MIYRAIGITGDAAVKGLEICFTEFQEQAGKWGFELLQTAAVPYDDTWRERLENAAALTAKEYQQLHVEYGKYAGQAVNKFIEQYNLHYKVALIAFSGPAAIGENGQQVGDGASVAALTQLPVVTDLFLTDAALGGHRSGNTILKDKLSAQADGKHIDEAVLTAFMGILRWRQEYNVFASETGALRDSIGGALWTGQDA